jgi:hypothetical protein
MFHTKKQYFKINRRRTDYEEQNYTRLNWLKMGIKTSFYERDDEELSGCTTPGHLLIT